MKILDGFIFCFSRKCSMNVCSWKNIHRCNVRMHETLNSEHLLQTKIFISDFYFLVLQDRYLWLFERGKTHVIFPFTFIWYTRMIAPSFIDAYFLFIVDTFRILNIHLTFLLSYFIFEVNVFSKILGSLLKLWKNEAILSIQVVRKVLEFWGKIKPNCNLSSTCNLMQPKIMKNRKININQTHLVNFWCFEHCSSLSLLF